MTDKRIETGLAEAMLAAFNEAKRLKYNAVRFFQMLSERGALPTAKALLAGDANRMSDGFIAMWNLQRLDLTVEAICLKPQFESLFTPQELATARARLERAEYNIDSAVTSSAPANLMSGSSQKERRLQVFLCHSSGDKPAVRKLYRRLKRDGCEPWLDEENLVPGQDWRQAIAKAVRSSSVVVVCLSRSSITKEGYVQKEIKIALDVADEKPEGTIFIIPARLEEEINPPERLGQLHWVDLFQGDGYEKLMSALRIRAKEIGMDIKRAAPTIRIAQIPSQTKDRWHDLREITGTVSGATTEDKVILFAWTDAWYAQPTSAQCYTNISPDGTFKNYTHFGTKFAAILVDTEQFNLSPIMKTLPQLGNGVLAKEERANISE